MKLLVSVFALVAISCVSGQQICDQYGSTTAGNYIVMNNRWGTSSTQCIEVTSNGFKIVQQDGVGNTSGAPVSYPAIYYGCHYSNCSPNTRLPLQINQIQTITSQISYAYVDGTYDAAYDIWLDPRANIDSNNAQEIMIWFAREGGINPIGGSSTGTVNIAGNTWDVFIGSNGSNQVISYVSQTSKLPGLNFNVMDFINDGKNRGLYTDQWYLTSIQAGFEPWVGGVGLAVTNFSIDM